MSIRRELKVEKPKQEFSKALKGFQSEVKPIAMDFTVSFDTIPFSQNTLMIKCILTHTSGHSETREVYDTS